MAKLSARDNFLETVRGGKPDRLVNGWEAVQFVFDALPNKMPMPGTTVVNGWGVTMSWPEGEPGCMPIINDETKVLPDVTEWREHVHAPVLSGELDWSRAKAEAERAHADGKLVISLVGTGLFEQCHFLMGFEDTLVNLLLEPEAMEELINYIAEWKLEYLRILCDNLQPDVICFHDDWGSKTNLFMNPDTWREFFLEPYRRIYAYMHERGVIAMHHSDTYAESIVQDMVDIGVDIWQGALPQNDIKKIIAETEGKLIIMGGIDASKVDLPVIDEQAIRTEVRRACAEYGPCGSFIPCMTYGTEGCIFPGVQDIVNDEISRYNEETYA